MLRLNKRDVVIKAKRKVAYLFSHSAMKINKKKNLLSFSCGMKGRRFFMNGKKYLEEFYKTTKNPTLKAMEYFLDELGHPEKKVKIIQ